METLWCGQNYNKRSLSLYNRITYLHTFCPIALNFLQGKNHQLTEYDEGMVRKYIEEIRVYEDKLTICFKSKLEVEIIR